jgi:hypothetical protein
VVGNSPRANVLLPGTNISRADKLGAAYAAASAAVFFLRHQARSPPLANSRQGSPAPAIGPGTATCEVPCIDTKPKSKLQGATLEQLAKAPGMAVNVMVVGRNVPTPL